MECASSAVRPPYEICARTFQFSCIVVEFCRSIELKGWIARHLAGQLLRSATGIGANVEEAQAPASRRDFASHAGIALREARETVYWLRLILCSSLAPEDRVAPLVAEARELVAILTAIVKKTRRPLARASAVLAFLSFMFLLLSFMFSPPFP